MLLATIKPVPISTRRPDEIAPPPTLITPANSVEPVVLITKRFKTKGANPIKVNKKQIIEVCSLVVSIWLSEEKDYMLEKRLNIAIIREIQVNEKLNKVPRYGVVSALYPEIAKAISNPEIVVPEYL